MIKRKNKRKKIRLLLPVISKDMDLTADDRKVYSLLARSSMASGAIARNTGFGKNKTVRILNELCEKGYVKKEGTGRGTKYKI